MAYHRAQKNRSSLGEGLFKRGVMHRACSGRRRLGRCEGTGQLRTALHLAEETRRHTYVTVRVRMCGDTADAGCASQRRTRARQSASVGVCVTLSCVCGACRRHRVPRRSDDVRAGSRNNLHSRSTMRSAGVRPAYSPAAMARARAWRAGGGCCGRAAEERPAGICRKKKTARTDDARAPRPMAMMDSARQHVSRVRARSQHAHATVYVAAPPR
jgi:hypothetical protein